LKKLLRLWPIFVLGIMTPISILHVDFVLAPILIGFFKVNSRLFSCIILGGIGFFELWVWYQGWSGLADLLKQFFEEDIEFMKKVLGEIKSSGILEWVKVFFVRRYFRLAKKAEAVKKFLRGSGYLSMFMAGLLPIWGPRVVCDFLCGTSKWKKGFIALAVGNFVKTAGFVFGWNSVFH